MSSVVGSLTAEQLFRLSESESQWCELVDGEIVRMSPPGAAHGFVSQNLSNMLGDFVNQARLGCVFAAETGFLISRDPDTVLAPDGSFVRADRIAAVGIPSTYFPEAPALVFEVVSPGDTVSQVGLKMRRWLDAGVVLAWVVDPTSRTVTVYRAADDIVVLTEKDTLAGGDVVPGFESRVADLFTGL